MSFSKIFKTRSIPFLDSQTYGRSPLENSSFIVSSIHPDASLHGSGFVARLSGSTAEFLSIWQIMMAGENPFFVQDDRLYLQFKPILPRWLFDNKGNISFCFLGNCTVNYHNPDKHNTYDGSSIIKKISLQTKEDERIAIEGEVINPPFAEKVRSGKIKQIDVYFG